MHLLRNINDQCHVIVGPSVNAFPRKHVHGIYQVYLANCANIADNLYYNIIKSVEEMRRKLLRVVYYGVVVTQTCVISIVSSLV